MLKYLKWCRFNNKWRISKKTALCTQGITAITCSSCRKLQVTFDEDCIWKVQYKNNDHESCKFHCYQVKLRMAGSFISSQQSLIWSSHSPPFTDPDGWCHIHNTATRPYPSTHSLYFFKIYFHITPLHMWSTLCMPFSYQFSTLHVNLLDLINLILF